MEQFIKHLTPQDIPGFVLDLSGTFSVQILINVICHINRLMKKNYMIILIDEEKAVEKIPSY